MNRQDEMDHRTRALLADASPRNWEETRRRLAVVRRYLRSEERSAEAAESHAKEIGVSRSLFYRLARIYSEGGGRQDEDVGRDRSEREDVIEQSIVRAGPAASVSQIFRTAVEIAAEQGLPNPSMSTVRIKATRRLAGSSIAARLGFDAEFALDRASLDIFVDAGVGRPVGAQLACLVDITKGAVVRHAVCAGPPGEREVMSLLLDAVPAGSRVAVSKSDPTLMVDAVRSTILRGEAVLVPGRWRAGRVLRTAVGLRIGRVRFLSDDPQGGDGAAVVALDTARQVIGVLMRRHGDRQR